jgi:hypothetical protein
MLTPRRCRVCLVLLCRGEITLCAVCVRLDVGGAT